MTDDTRPTWEPVLTIDPGIQFGRVCIPGTRIRCAGREVGGVCSLGVMLTAPDMVTVTISPGDTLNG